MFKFLRFKASKATRLFAFGAVFIAVVFSKMFSADLPMQQIKSQPSPLGVQLQEVVNRFKDVVPKAQFKISVKRVIDGDTFVDVNDRRYRIAYIDAPESGQAFGTESSDFLKILIENKEITLTELYLDKYERAVVIAYLDGIDIAEILVEYGYAWNQASVYNASQLYIEKMNALEAKSKQNNAGLWALENNVKPVEYRKGQEQDAVKKVYE